MPTTPPYTPHSVRLMGHRNLGTVQARWLGCILELEDGTRYGPCAVFDAVPVAEPVEPAPLGDGANVAVLRDWTTAAERWILLDGNNQAVAGCNSTGWWAQQESMAQLTGPETGLLGKEKATEALLDVGYKWIDDKASRIYRDELCTAALRRFTRGDEAITTDRVTRKVAHNVSTGPGMIAFDDGTWMDYREAEQQIAARIPGDDDIPF